MVHWHARRSFGFVSQSRPGNRTITQVVIILGLAALFPLGIGHGILRAQTSAQSSAPAQPAPGQTPPAYNAEVRSKAILSHLNAVLRFYRDSEAPIQKVGQPSDLVYSSRAITQAMQIAGLAFQSAKAESVLMQKPTSEGPAVAAAGNQVQRIQETLTKVNQQIAALKAQAATLDKQLSTATLKQRATLQQQREVVEGELELQSAMASALGKIASIAATSNETGFSAQINQLERSAPGLIANKPTAVAPTLENLSAMRSAGVVSQAQVLIELMDTREAIDNLISESEHLHKQAVALRAPLITLLKSTVAQGQALLRNSLANPSPTAKTAKAMPKVGGLSPQMPASSPAQQDFHALTTTFNSISSATVPLSQEALTLEQNQASLQAWRIAVNDEYKLILRSVLARVFFIAIALLVILALSEAWRRATKRYVREIRRRRQLLVVRRLITGFLCGLVLIFGLVTQFSSLATFAGFITAGIAVGLQTILLSVAAYFFIIGRYGIKVGDRITISGVTGDVVEVGLVRFYMLEMAGSGADLYSTGRVAVFSNAILFQAGTPLYKQRPGSQYAWHELAVKLSPDADYRPAVQGILKTLQSVYEGYREQIEQQHRNLESWVDSSVDFPAIQSNLQLADNGLQFWARFPVIIHQAAATDQKLTEALLQLISSDQSVKAAVAAPPTIKAAIKG